MTEHLSQQQRDAYITASQRQAQEVLQIPEVQYRLGGYANELFVLTQSVVSARVEDGIVHSYDVHPRLTPATVIRVGEAAARVASRDLFDEHQWESMRHDHDDAQVNDLVGRYKRVAEGKTNNLYPFDRELAHMHTQDVVKNRPPKIRLKGRPMVVFNWDASQRQSVDAPVWFHELEHVKQARKLSIWNPEVLDPDAQELSWELEGYSVAAMTILGIQDAGRQKEFLSSIPRISLDRTLEIEEIRKRANRYETDPYAASREVSEELISNSYGITEFLANKIQNK